MTDVAYDDAEKLTAPWWQIETITIATARLATLNAQLAEICADRVAHHAANDPTSTVELATAERVLRAHVDEWSAVVPESVRLEMHRVPRPMPAMFVALRDGGQSDFDTVISALRDATHHLASGLDNPEGRPFQRVCETVLSDLDLLGDTASGAHAATFGDTLSVFTLE
jgi:hypothetical protein